MYRPPQAQARPQSGYSLAVRARFERGPSWHRHLRQVAPALAIAHEAAAKIGVDGVHRHEHVDRSAAPVVERNVVKQRAALHRAGDQLLVDVDHIDALLDRRRQIDRLERGRALPRCGRGRCLPRLRDWRALDRCLRRLPRLHHRRPGRLRRRPRLAVLSDGGCGGGEGAERDQGISNGHRPINSERN